MGFPQQKAGLEGGADQWAAGDARESDADGVLRAHSSHTCVAQGKRSTVKVLAGKVRGIGRW